MNKKASLIGKIFWLIVFVVLIVGLFTLYQMSQKESDSMDRKQLYKDSIKVQAGNTSDLIRLLDECKEREGLCVLGLPEGDYEGFTYQYMDNVVIVAENKDVVFTRETSNSVIELYDVENSIIDGFTIQANNRGEHGIEVRGWENNEITNLEVYNAKASGIKVNGNCKFPCKAIKTSSGGLVANNYVNGAGWNGIDVYIARNIIVEDNEVENVVFVGIILDSNVRNNIVRNNYVHDIEQDGIQVKGWKGDSPSWEFTTLNLVYGNKLEDIALDRNNGEFAQGMLINHNSYNTLVAHNQILRVATGAISYNDEGGNCYKQSENAQNILLLNNNVEDCLKNGYDTGGKSSSGLVSGNEAYLFGSTYYSDTPSPKVINLDTGANAQIDQKVKVGEWTYYKQARSEAPETPEKYAVYQNTNGATCVFDFMGDGAWLNIAQEGTC